MRKEGRRGGGKEEGRKRRDGTIMTTSMSRGHRSEWKCHQGPKLEQVNNKIKQYWILTQM